MSGHSKWHNIQHKKGLVDAARSGLFTKLAREITMAAKLGDKNPDNNPRYNYPYYLHTFVKTLKAYYLYAI